MANVSYDTLTIEIMADSSNARKDIASLSKNLRKLDETAKAIDKERIEEVKTLLLDISKIDFSNVSKGLNDVVSAFKAFNNNRFMKATQQGINLSGVLSQNELEKQGFQLIGDSYSKDFEIAEQSLVAVNNQLVIYKKNVDEAVNATNGMAGQSSLFEQLKQKLYEAGLNGEQVKAVFRSIKSEANVFNVEQLEAVKKVFEEMGLSAEEVDKIIRHLKTDVEKMGDSGVKSTNKWINAFKRIAFYRIIRRIIQMIAQSIKSAFEELAKYNQDFNRALGEIKSSFSYLARSIVAIIAPIIKVIAPIINAINSTLASIGNSIAEAFSGEEVIIAKENIEDYIDTAEKAQHALSIDELNVINKDEDKDLFETIKNSIGEGNKLEGVFAKIRSFVDLINDNLLGFVRKILPDVRAILGDIFDIVGDIMDIVKEFVGGTADGVNDSLSSFIGFIREIVGMVKQIASPILTLIKSLLNSFKPILNVINYTIKFVFDMLQPIIKLLGVIISDRLTVMLAPLTIINNIIASILSALYAVGQTIYKLINRDFAGIGQVWEEWKSTNKNMWLGSLSDIFNSTIVGKIYANNTGSELDLNQMVQGNVNEDYSAFLDKTGYQNYGNGEGIVANVNNEVEVRVYLDSREIARQIEIIDKNKGSGTLSYEGLSYGK